MSNSNNSTTDFEESQRFDRKKKFVIAGLILLLVLVIIVVPVTLRFSHADLIEDFPSDCTNLTLSNAKASSATGGVFDIYPESKENPIRVYCDLHTDGGGWIVFQRRYDGSTNFNRKRKDYVNGFGEPDKEMWLGLETIHRLTKNGVHELRVDLEDFSGNVRYAKYSVFHIASEIDTYRLKVIGYSGTAGDALEMHSDRVFSTEEDNIPGENCGTPYYGGWWYGPCYNSNLNGLYYKNGRYDNKGIIWIKWKMQTLKSTEMKFRRRI